MRKALRKYLSRLGTALLLLFLICSPWGLGQEKMPVPEFAFWTVGNSVRERFGDQFYSSLSIVQKDKNEFSRLLQALAGNTPKEQQLIKRYGISPSWLTMAVDTLISLNVIGKNEKSEYYSKVPVMTDNTMGLIQQDIKPIAVKIAEKIAAKAPTLKETYNNAKKASDPGWEYVSHLVLDKFLIDGFFHQDISVLERKKGIKRYYSKEQKTICAFFLEKRSRYGTFGVNWYGIKGKDKKDERDVYILHGAVFNRFEIPFNTYGWDKSFAPIFQRIDADGSLEKLNREEKQIFADLGWIKNNRLAIPFINISSLTALKKELETLANETALILFDHFSVIMDSYKHSSYSYDADSAGDYIQVCYHLLFSSIINELIERGVVPPVPDSPSETYGVYITMGNFFNP